MAKLNNVTVVPRHNRPATTDKVQLELHILNGGLYVNPYQVSSVFIFKDTTASSAEFPYISNGLPEQFIDNAASSTRYGLIAASALGNEVFRFINSATLATDSNPTYDTSNFNGEASSTSGIWRSNATIDGMFSVVLVPGASSTTEDLAALVIATSGLGAGNYFDIWTVRHVADGPWKTYLNRFSLFADTFVGLTEALEVIPTVKLRNRYIENGSKTHLAFGVDFTVANENMANALKNIFRDSIIRNAAVKINKVNEAASNSTKVQVSGFADTSSVIHITSTDDVLFLWDTADLPTIANATEDFGAAIGVYEVQLQFDILTETHRSPKYRVIVR